MYPVTILMNERTIVFIYIEVKRCELKQEFSNEPTMNVWFKFNLSMGKIDSVAVWISHEPPVTVDHHWQQTSELTLAKRSRFDTPQ